MPEVATGTYSGNGGTLDVNLTFTPAWVCIFRHNQRNWMHMKTMTAGHAIDAGGTNRISSGGITLGTNKFTLGSNAGVNAAGQVHHYIAIAEESTYAKVSTFTGDGNVGQQINGVGFQPDLIIIVTLQAYDIGLLWSSTPGGNLTFRFTTGFGPAAGYVTGVHADGFAIGGPGSSINGLGTVCYYIALRVKPLNIGKSTYPGDGGFTGRVVTMPDPFLSKFVIVHSVTNGVTIFRPNSLAGDHSFYYANGVTDIGYAVQTLTVTGFTVGYELNTNGLTYFYFAFQANSEIFDNALGCSSQEALALDTLLGNFAFARLVRDEVIASQAFPPDFLIWEFELGEAIQELLVFDTVIPVVLKDRNLYPVFDYVLSVAGREQVQLDTIIADYADRFDEWVQEAIQSDNWIKEATVNDVWVKENPVIDSWSKE